MTDKHETTDMTNEKWKTHEPVIPKYKNGVEAFNDLSPPPCDRLDLGDGRELHIQSWEPVGNYKTIDGILDVTVRGFIRRKRVS